MAEKFDELREQLSPEARKRAEERKKELLAEMPLQELRKARELTQQQLARSLGNEQSSISKLEHRTDVYLSTLRSYIEAMGGSLEIRARFPEGAYRINQFEALDESPDEKGSPDERDAAAGRASAAPRSAD